MQSSDPRVKTLGYYIYHPYGVWQNRHIQDKPFQNHLSVFLFADFVYFIGNRTPDIHASMIRTIFFLGT